MMMTMLRIICLTDCVFQYLLCSIDFSCLLTVWVEQIDSLIFLSELQGTFAVWKLVEKLNSLSLAPWDSMYCFACQWIFAWLCALQHSINPHICFQNNATQNVLHFQFFQATFEYNWQVRRLAIHSLLNALVFFLVNCL